MKEDNELYQIAVEKLLKLSSLVDPSDEEHYVDFPKEDFIEYYNFRKITAIDMANDSLSVITENSQGYTRKAIYFSDLDKCFQLKVIEIIDKYINSFNNKPMKLYQLIASNACVSSEYDKTICICDEEGLKGCIIEILWHRGCTKQAIALYIKKALIGSHGWNDVFYETQEDGDDFNYDTRAHDYTLRIEEITLNEVDVDYY